MAKDPAFLFYTSDFLVGTMTMTHDQVGKYIRLLCLQHQKGKLTSSDIEHFGASNDSSILEKFVCTEGTYYNTRLQEESEKRKKHSEHQKNNASMRWQYQTNAKPMPTECQTDAKPMPNVCDGNAIAMPLENENENVNVNEDVNVVKGGAGGKMKTPTLIEVQDYFEEKNFHKEAESFFNYYESNGWKVGKNPMKNWKASAQNWIKNTDRYANNNKSNGQRINKADYQSAAAQYDFQKYGDTPVGEIFGITGSR